MLGKDEVVAVIPVREGSQRIQNKNFRPFGGAPTLVHHKGAQLKAAGCFDHIYVSSDSARAKEIALESGAEFLPREPFFCTGAARWHEVVVHIMNTIPGNPHVAWAMATSPIFANYAGALKVYEENLGTHDSLVAVRAVREYLVDEAGRPLFFSFGAWHPYTTEIKPLYSINDALFVAKKSDQLNWQYWIGRQPHLFVCNAFESIDVNFEEDLAVAHAAWDYLTRPGSRT